jgi:transposase
LSTPPRLPCRTPRATGPQELQAVPLLSELEEKIEAADRQIELAFQCNGDCQRIAAMVGIGPSTATAFDAAISYGRAFDDGRQFAASLGLFSRQSSNGVWTKMLGISKHGEP